MAQKVWDIAPEHCLLWKDLGHFQQKESVKSWTREYTPGRKTLMEILKSAGQAISEHYPVSANKVSKRKTGCTDTG